MRVPLMNLPASWSRPRRPTAAYAVLVLTMLAGSLAGSIAFAAGRAEADGYTPAPRRPALTEQTPIPRRPGAPSNLLRFNVPRYYNWAFIDRRTNQIHGVRIQWANYSESTVKIWLAADYLNRADAAGRTLAGWEWDRLSRMIRLSDDVAADLVWSANGGNAGINRMISRCHLGDTTMYPGWWSKTLISSRDLARLGLCIADGTASPRWTSWLLNEMRNVGGDGLFGIKFALAEPDRSLVAIKNGWFMHGTDNKWRVHCLAVHPDWVLAVETKYPGSWGRSYGEQLCVNAARYVFSLTFSNTAHRQRRG